MPNTPPSSSQKTAKPSEETLRHVAPVDLMAVERTVTALFGTAISFIVLGFVIERFQLFLAVAAAELPPEQRPHFPELGFGLYYHYLGIAIIVGGVFLALYSYIYYNRWILLLQQHKIETDRQLFKWLALFITTIALFIIASMTLL